jgi:NADPH:quinone reductase-like Zn-dependent oxidoreductase
MMMQTMKAVIVEGEGGPEQLQLREIARPVPGPGEVLVKVKFASVNAVDKRVRGGYLREYAPRPYTVGADFAGVVEQTGEGADLPPGTRVFGGLMPNTGGYAEYVKINAADVARIPDGVSFEQAASLPVAGLTAWSAIIALGELQPGQRVLVQGAAGGVGHFAVQMAHRLGAYVIGVASAPKAGFVRALGADEVLDYAVPDYATGLHDLDLVVDGVDAASMARVYPAVKPGGRVFSLFDPPPPAPAGVRAELLAGGTGPGTLREKLGNLAAMVARGELAPQVTAIYSLSQAAEAQESARTGKVLIRQNE